MQNVRLCDVCGYERDAAVSSNGQAGEGVCGGGGSCPPKASISQRVMFEGHHFHNTMVHNVRVFHQQLIPRE